MNLELACLDRDIDGILKSLTPTKLPYIIDLEEECFEDSCIVIPTYWNLNMDVSFSGISYEFTGEYPLVASSDDVILLIGGVILVVHAKEYEPLSFYFFT